MTTQERVVSFLKALGTNKVVETFQVSRQVANVWINKGNVPLAKFDRIHEEMLKFEAQQQENEVKKKEAIIKDALQAEAKVASPTPHEPLPLIPVVATPNKPGDYEERFQIVDQRLDKIEDYIRRVTDPDIVRTATFTRPSDDSNKPNAIMEPIFRGPDTKVMTEEEHEKAMSEAASKIHGSGNWLEPYKTPPGQRR